MHEREYRVPWPAAVASSLFGSATSPVLYRLSCGKNRPEHVDVEVLMELIFGDLFQPCEPVDAGIVHQDIQPAECLLGFLETAAPCRPLWRRRP